ncbi:MAG: hypothetical protein GPOALKHO_000527 [Sodalis sp.]|nr:MAG: hypothetical protein GPOALKHO_000527 [Sodalis sp.]
MLLVSTMTAIGRGVSQTGSGGRLAHRQWWWAPREAVTGRPSRVLA